MSKIADALERFQANGDGSAVTDEDMQAVTEYMINKLVGSGVPIREAADIISLHKWDPGPRAGRPATTRPRAITRGASPWEATTGRSCGTQGGLIRHPAGGSSGQPAGGSSLRQARGSGTVPRRAARKRWSARGSGQGERPKKPPAAGGSTSGRYEARTTGRGRSSRGPQPARPGRPECDRRSSNARPARRWPSQSRWLA